MADEGNSTTIFQEGNQGGEPTTPAATPAPAAPAAPTIPEGVSEFIGEGKKYSTVEEALKSVPHAQAHIQKLEAEKLELEGKISSASDLEKQFNTLKEDMRKASEGQNTTAPQPTPIDPNEIAGLVKEAVAGMNAEQVAASNLSTTDMAVKNKFGENAVAEFKKTAVDNGLSADEMMLLASRSPKAFLKLFDIVEGKRESKPSTTGGSVNTQQFQGTPPAPVKSVMSGAKKGDLIAAWNASKPQE